MPKRSSYNDLIDALIDGATINIDAAKEPDFKPATLRKAFSRIMRDTLPEFLPEKRTLSITTGWPGPIYTLSLVDDNKKLCYTVVDCPPTGAREHEYPAEAPDS